MPKFRVTSSAGDWVMDAPMSTLILVFQLHPSAVARIQSDIRDGGVGVLHFNRRPTLGYLDAVSVTAID